MVFLAKISDLGEVFEAAKVSGVWPAVLPPLDRDAWVSGWSRFLGNGAFLLVLRGGSGEIAGAIGGIVAPSVQTGRSTAYEVLWFGPMTLVDEFLRIAKDRGAEFAVLSISTNNAERATRLYKYFVDRWGYMPFEQSYIGAI